MAVARMRFPDLDVSVETFGNAVTATAAASGVAANDVRGVAIDHHDPGVEVLLGLLVSGPPKRSASHVDADHAVGSGAAG